MIDERSARNIATLRAKVQPLAAKLIETAAEQGICAKVICGTRTYDEQDELYAQGRTLPGKIVTRAKGGQSWHNFGVAFDVGIFSSDGKKYFGESEAYHTVGKIGEALGLEWGGSWEGFVDEPHFQFNPLGLSLAQVRARTEKEQDLFT